MQHTAGVRLFSAPCAIRLSRFSKSFELAKANIISAVTRLFLGEDAHREGHGSLNETRGKRVENYESLR